VGRRIVTGDEQDAFTGWRRYLRWHPGQLAAVKCRARRRERRDARAEIAARLRDCDRP
jgi:hypothetical protein